MRLLAEGLTTREIADQLYISPKTADRHVQHVYAKIGVSNRVSAALWLNRAVDDLVHQSRAGRSPAQA